MAAFSQHLPPVLVDSVFSPNSPLKNSGVLDEFFPNWTQFFPNSSGNLSFPPSNLEDSSIDASNHESSCLEQQSFNGGKQSTPSLLSMADKAETESGEQVTQVYSPVHRKRKSRNGSSFNSSNSKEVKQAKEKKEKGDKETKKGDKKDKKDQNKANIEEPPKGYIHVRARRGQATDSHSLAERVRREKISERMKMLQALVPGCDKVTGKALMLDEIINYVQSLQNQVEFLSMRLASMDPMIYNFGLMDLDPATSFGTQGMISTNNSMALPSPSIQSSSYSAASVNSSLPITLVDAKAAATSTAAVVGGVAQPPAYVNTSPHFRHEQKPSVLPIQGNRSVYLGSGMDVQQQMSFFNQFGFGANN